MNIPFVVDFNSVYGLKTSNGWTGIVGEIVNNRCDVGISYFSATLERFNHAKMSPPLTYSSAVSILSGQIRQNYNQNVFHFMNAFTIDLRIIIVFTLILLAIIDYIIHLNNSDITDMSQITFVSNISVYFKLLLTQSSEHFSRICCVKHLFFIGIGILLMSLLPIFFNSEILSKLLYDPFIIIDSMDDLVSLIHKKNISVYVQRGAFNLATFRTIR